MLRTQKSQRSGIVPVANNRVYSDLINAVRSHKLNLIFTATATVAGGITSVRNRGSVLALYNRIGVEDNGDDVVQMDARLLRFIAEAHAPSALFASRMGFANGTYLLRENVIIHFAHPLAIAPNETAYIEADPRQQLRVFVDYNGVSANLGVAGAGTIVVTVPAVNVQQEYDDKRQEERPILLPYYREITQAIASASVQTPIYLKSDKFIRFLAVQQDTNAGEANDVITSLVLRGDARAFIGPQNSPMNDLQDDSLSEFGGNVLGGGGLITAAAEVPIRAYLGFNAQRNGRLASIINPARDVNLRFEVNAQPSAMVGATSSTIRIGLLELREVAGLTVPAKERGFDL